MKNMAVMFGGAVVIGISVMLWSIPVAAFGFAMVMYPGVKDLIDYRKSC